MAKLMIGHHQALATQGMLGGSEGEKDDYINSRFLWARLNILKLAVYFSPKIRSQLQQMIKNRLGIVEHVGTLQYLRVAIIGCKPRRLECGTVEHEIQEQQDVWQARALFMMGRIILVKSVLSSMFIYLLSNTVMPKNLVVRLEKHFLRFLWSSHPRGSGLYLLA